MSFGLEVVEILSESPNFTFFYVYGFYLGTYLIKMNNFEKIRRVFISARSILPANSVTIK